ncbi:MAG: hypothetical protein ACK559_32105, partial [bacterium]
MSTILEEGELRLGDRLQLQRPRARPHGGDADGDGRSNVDHEIAEEGVIARRGRPTNREDPSRALRDAERVIRADGVERTEA